MTQGALQFGQRPPELRRGTISPLLELGAYEWLWLQPGASFRRLSQRFAADPECLPSEFVDHAVAMETGQLVVARLRERGVDRFGVRIHRAGEYPSKLRDAEHPIELLYFAGFWDLVEAPCVAVVGTRKPTNEGVRRARKLAKMLVQSGHTVVSGLAAGIDTAAHGGALDAGGRTIAVLGTPLCEHYPAENAGLQQRIAADHLVMSQVPVLRHLQAKHPKVNRFFFPERNVTMSALTLATVIVEAGNTSGTHTQGRAALRQGRKLFILESCFHNPDLTWPREFEALGAKRIADFEQIVDELQVHEGR